MENKVIFRPYKVGDEEDIVKLLIDVFKGWPHFNIKCAPIDHWRWKHSTLHKPLIAIAEVSGDIIGCWHRIPQKIKFGDNIIYGAQGVDVVVHSDFRGLKISSKMRELTYELSLERNIKIGIGVNTNPLIRKSAERRGGKSLPMVSEFIKIKNLDLYYNNIKYKSIRKISHNLISKYNQVSNSLIYRFKKNENNIKIYQIKKFDSKITEFWDKIKDHYSYIVVRDENFLNWRYCDFNGGEYIIKLAEQNNQILGYCVLRINICENEYPAGYIVDLIAIPNRYDVIYVLIHHAINFFNENNITFIRSWESENNITCNILKTHGFVKSQSRVVNYRFLNKNSTVKTRIFNQNSTVHFSMGDSDPI